MLACSDCYARSATDTYALIGGLAAFALVCLLGALLVRKRQRVRRRAAITVTAMLSLPMIVGLALPAMPVGGWQAQPGGSKYKLVCGSAIHASLQEWTGAAGDAVEARDRAYCSRWGQFNVHLGEGLLGAAALVSLAFLTMVGVGGGRVKIATPSLAT